MFALLTVRVVAGLIAFFVAGVGAFAYFVIHGRPAPAEPAVVEAPKVVGPVHTVVGTSVEGRSIDAYSYGSGPTQLLFVGGIHGGYEWNSSVLAYSAMDYFIAHPEAIPQSLTVTVIPAASPDGTFKVVGKAGRFSAADVPTTVDQSAGRFNAHGVDLNRNFDCKWQPKSTWKERSVSAGTAPFSEPEAAALRDFIQKIHPTAVVLWHSQANGVFASQCENGILPKTLDIMNAYATASGYPAIQTFDAYPTTGAAEDWLAKVGIPAITVELTTHEGIEWEKNLAGITALIDYYGQKNQ